MFKKYQNGIKNQKKRERRERAHPPHQMSLQEMEAIISKL